MIWRIRERAAFDRLARHGTRIRTPSLWCTYLLDPDATPPRVAYAIGRAVGPATARNRLRRRLRSALTDASTMPLPPGWYLVGARPRAVELTFDQMRSEVQHLRTMIARPPAAPSPVAVTGP